jgi:hypothetical protein
MATTALSHASGTTAGVAISATPVTLRAMTITAAANAVVTVYDNASAASGTILFQKNFAAADNNYQIRFPESIKPANGLYLVVATAAAGITFYVN